MVATNYSNLLGAKPLGPRNASRGRLAEDPDMNRDAIRLIDHQLDGAVVLTRGEIHQRVLVAAQFGLHLLQMGHAFMLA